MTKPPLILVSPNIESKGQEFADLSISLSARYQQALMKAGGIPLTLPATVSREVIAESVSRCDGVLMTGGEDVNPELYGNGLPAALKRKAMLTPDGGARDYREIVLVDEVFRQRKPLLAICRGHQILNVALGGSLIVDIPSQRNAAFMRQARTQKKPTINHRRMDKRSDLVHEVRLTADSLLAKITGAQTLGVNSTHHQAVNRIAPALRPVAVCDDGIIEGLELKPSSAGWLPFLLSVQFHPERLADRYPEHQAIFCAFAQACMLNRRNNL
jgi:putative glutamine amidotransferase